MANLLDTIRQSSQPRQADETQGLQTLLRAKSGKAVGGEVASNLGEQQANVQSATDVRTQVLPTAVAQDTAQKQASAGIAQNVAAQKSDISQARRADSLESRLKTNQILQNLEQSRGQIDQQRKDADIAQVAQNLRLQTKQYTDNLQREGAMSRLNSEIRFKEELSRTNFGDNEALLKTSLGNKSVLDANDREFSKALGAMSVANAYDIFKSDLEAQKQRGMFQGIAGITQAGIGAYGTGAGMKANSAAASNTQAQSTARNESIQPTSDVSLMRSRQGV